MLFVAILTIEAATLVGPGEGKEVKEGDVILLDYTAAGTQVSLNGKALGVVEGAAFNQALLRVWLGGNPVDASLKKAMLGQ